MILQSEYGSHLHPSTPFTKLLLATENVNKYQNHNNVFVFFVVFFHKYKNPQILLVFVLCRTTQPGITKTDTTEKLD